MQNEQTTQAGRQTPPVNGNQGQDLVTVTINGTAKDIHRGSHTITELKTLLGVEASQALDEVIGGEFKPLDDTGRITIKGGEVFVSHARHGGSS